MPNNTDKLYTGGKYVVGLDNINIKTGFDEESQMKLDIRNQSGKMLEL